MKEDGPTIPQEKYSGRQWSLKCELPLPSVEELDVMERETNELSRETKVSVTLLVFLLIL